MNGERAETWVNGCPCGRSHRLPGKSWGAFQKATAGMPPTVLIVTGDGSWLVPRIYIALHIPQPDDVPALAKHYGWERPA